jgi:predicted PurR-regulated permease PerM
MAHPNREVQMTRPAEHPAASSTKTSFWTTLILTVIAVFLLTRVIRPFAAALFIAAVLAAAIYPLFQKLSARLGERRTLASGLTTLAVVLVVILPLAWLGVVLAQEVADGVSYVRRTLRSEGVEGLISDLPAPLRTLATRVLEKLPQGEQELTEVAGAQGGRAATAVGNVLQATWGAIVQIVMMLIAFFFLLVDGPRLVNWFVEVLPLRRQQTLMLLTDFRKVTVAVLVSSIATSAIQATVALAGYLIARVPNPLFFAFVTFLVGLVPAVGAGAVTLFAALILFLSGHPGAALFLAIWGVVAVGLADNVVKPYLIRTGISLHGAVVFFSLLGGLAHFGPVGLLAGPLIVSFFMAVVHMWKLELDEADQRSKEPLLPAEREPGAELEP